ncbi:MAG: phosphonate ABC transporter, permease protein PhnE [Acetobacteraceae bacterium]
MSLALTRLPDIQLAPLRSAYAEAKRAKRRQTLLGVLVLALAVLISGHVAEVRPHTLWSHFGDFFNYFIRLVYFDSGPQAGDPVWTDVGEWFWGLTHWLSLLFDTILIAYLATLAGSLGAFFACFLSARNLGPNPLLRGIVKRLLELCRTVPEIVFALIFVVAFGLGAVPGVLAIAIHTLGANGKLFTEVVENIDMKPVEGAIAAGGTWSEAIRFAVLPQVLSNFTSYALLRFEINVRGASVMGFVGAGGIGQDLIEAIRKFYYTDVSAILLLILVTVFLIDAGSQKLRHTLLGLEERP